VSSLMAMVGGTLAALMVGKKDLGSDLMRPLGARWSGSLLFSCSH
jgi:hypothetical protein